MPKVHRWDGNSYVEVPWGTLFKYWDPVGLQYVPAKTVRYWDGNQWVIAWNKSDPVTVVVDANFSSNLRYTGSSYTYDSNGTESDNTVANPMIGRFGGSYDYHFIGLLGFDLTNILAAQTTRPKVTSARLRLTRLSGAGLGTISNANPVRIGNWNRASWESIPSVSDPVLFTDFANMTTESLNGWSTGNRWIDITTSIAEKIIAGDAMAMSEVTTGYNSSGNTTNLYSKLGGVGNGTIPQLEVTLDY